MSGENINVYGTQIALEPGTSSAAIASGVMSAKAANTYDLTANGYYPDAVFALVCTFGGTPVENSTIVLSARPLLIDGTNSAQVPETTRLTRQIGNFVVNDVATIQAMELIAYDLPINAEYYLFNNATGQSVSAGWKLYIKPRTVKLAP